MADAARSASNRLRHLAIELENLADAMERPSRTTARSDMLIAECERIAADVRAVVRGRGRPSAQPLWHRGGQAAW
jgi:hypothetical protein